MAEERHAMQVCIIASHFRSGTQITIRVRHQRVAYKTATQHVFNLAKVLYIFHALLRICLINQKHLVPPT